MIGSHILPELKMGLASLFAHKLRSLLTMLGMIFGVGAVVAMLSITAGAPKEMMSFIDQLGVNNIIVEAHEALDRNELQPIRAISPGLSSRDFRAISENVSGLVGSITPRKRFKPQKLLPKTANDPPQLIGVLPNYVEINSLRMTEGRFFTEEENKSSAPVCVLGESTKVNLLGYDPGLGKYIKVNDTWMQVIGVLTPQASGDADVEGAQAANRNNLVIAPLNTVMRRFEDNTSYLKDEIDGIYMKVGPNIDSIETSNVVRAILTATHKDAGDFTVIVPAGLLEQKKQTQMIFNVVMICIAGISLLVGGIGIMNIMLATVLENPRNRNPSRDRCAAEGHRPSVPDGGRADLDRGRLDRNRVRRHAVEDHRVGRGLVDPGDRVVDRRCVRRFRVHRVVVWYLSGRAGRKTGSHRGHSLRVELCCFEH